MVYGMDSYDLDFPDGLYDITLQFCELYFKEKGRRLFDVLIQNKTVLKEFEILAEEGFGHAVEKSFNKIRVKNGKIHLKFLRTTDNPSLAGIIICDSGTKKIIRKINCGGNVYKDYEADPGMMLIKTEKVRDLYVGDFYDDWARSEFGPEVAKSLAELFTKLDGGPFSTRAKITKLPRPAAWIGGPGGISVNNNSWDKEKEKYAFVDEMSALRPKIVGSGNLDRFDYWLNSFQFLKSIGEIGCTRGNLDKIIVEIDQVETSGIKKELAEKALEIRIELARQWEKMMTLLLQTVSTPGELGTVANCEQHVRRNNRGPRFLDFHDKKLTELIEKPLPESVNPTTSYVGSAKIIVPTQRSHIKQGEKLSITVILLDKNQPGSATLFWKEMGTEDYSKTPLKHKARSTYTVTLPPATGDAIEYYITAEMTGGLKLFWPATAPQLNQTVVIN